jgi:hypothetical protein
METIPGPPHRPGIKNLSKEALHDLVHFDRKIFKTIPLLLFKPGYLTEKSLSGDRDLYVRPFSLFVFLNFVFFLIKSKGVFNYTLSSYQNRFAEIIAKKQAALHITAEIMSERFNTAIRFEEKEYLVIMVPLFALFVMILYFKKKYHYGEHLFFSLHFYSFFIILLSLLAPFLRFVQWLMDIFHTGRDLTHSEYPLVIVMVVTSAFYLFISLKRVYRQNNLLTIVKALILSISVIFLIVYVYRIALFFIVLRSLSE